MHLPKPFLHWLRWVFEVDVKTRMPLRRAVIHLIQGVVWLSSPCEHRHHDIILRFVEIRFFTHRAKKRLYRMVEDFTFHRSEQFRLKFMPAVASPSPMLQSIFRAASCSPYWRFQCGISIQQPIANTGSNLRFNVPAISIQKYAYAVGKSFQKNSKRISIRWLIM